MSASVCEFCGARSILGDLFQSWPVGLRRRGLICPRCRVTSRKSRRIPGLKFILMALVFAGGFALDGPWLGAIWVLGAFFLPILITVGHEWAHAVAALLCGGKVFEVRIGWREPRWQIRVGRIRFTVARGLFRGGYCVAAFLSPRVSRLRYAILYGTPMILHAAAIAAVWPYLSPPHALREIGLLDFFVAFNLLLLLASARPFDHHVGAFQLPSDGMAIILLATHRARVEKWRRLGFVLPAIYALLDGEKEEALARAREVEHMFPDDPDVGRALFTVYWALGYFAYALRFIGTYVHGVRQPEQLDERQLLSLGAMQGKRFEKWLYCVVCLHGEAWDAAIKEIDELLEAESFEEARAMWFALRAYVLLLRASSPGDLEEARAAAQRAFDRLPWVSFICGTLAATLIESGMEVEGLYRLEQADLLDRDDRELAARNAWRAIGMARQGRRRMARRYLREAEAQGLEVGPPPALLRRVEQALEQRS